MTTASMKRIIWSIGFMLVWAVNDIMLTLRYPLGYPYEDIYQIMMFIILLIPLLFFENDNDKKSKKAMKDKVNKDVLLK